jgi:hypothetical protein
VIVATVLARLMGVVVMPIECVFSVSHVRIVACMCVRMCRHR